MNQLALHQEGGLTQGSVIEGVDWDFEPSPPLSIVLSSPCDLEHDKASFILVSPLTPAKDIIQNSQEFTAFAEGASSPVSKTKWDKILPRLAAYIHNVNITRYFFIDPGTVIDSPELLVDFQCLQIIEIEKKDSLQIVAALPSPDREKMISHFGAYVSRIGVDRFDKEDELRIAKNLAAPFVPQEPPPQTAPQQV